MQNEYLVHHEQDSQSNELIHYGTKDMKWRHRRYQNYDGSLTPLGRIHYGVGEKRERKKQEAAAAVAKREEAMKYKPLSEKQQRIEQLAKDDREEEFRRQENVEKSEEKRYRDVRSMSDDEIAAYKKRLQSEKDLINLQNDLDKLSEAAKPWYVRTVKKMVKSYVDSLSENLVKSGVQATADFLGLDFNTNNGNDNKKKQQKKGDLDGDGKKDQYKVKRSKNEKADSNENAGNEFVDPKTLPKGTIFKTRTVAKTPEGMRYVYTGTGTGTRSQVPNKPKDNKPNNRPVAQAEITVMRMMADQGRTYTEIGDRFDISPSYAAKLVKNKKGNK